MKLIDKFIKFFYGSLFFLTPLIFTFNTSELFEFNKIIFIYLITILIAFLWILKMILTKKIIFKKTFLDIPILFFLITQIISTVFSIDMHTSMFGYYGRFNGGLMSILSYIILYYGFVSNIISYEYILKTSIFSSFLVMLYGLPGKLGHDITCLLVTKGAQFNNSCWDNAALQFKPEIRTFSTLGQPNWLGAYLAINFFIGLYYLIKNIKNNKLFILNFLYLLVNFSFILFSGSRSALLSLIIGLILFFSFYVYFLKIDRKRILINLIIIILIPILLFKTGISKIDNFLDLNFIKKNNSKVVTNLTNSINQNVTESLDIRKIVWKGAINLGLKYPLFGTGVETFAYSYNFVRPIEHNLTSEWDFIYNKAHNEFLNYLATTGFIGLGSYLLLIFVFSFFILKKLFFSIKKIQNNNHKNYFKDVNATIKFDTQVLILSLFIAYLTIQITNFFGFSTSTTNIFFYLIPAIFIVVINNNKNDINLSENKNIYQYFSIFVILRVTIYLLFSVFAYWIADTYYALGVNYLNPQISDYQQASILFEKALKTRYEPIYEDKLSSSLSYLAALASYQKQNDVSMQLIKLSNYYNDKTISTYSKNIYFWKTRAKNQYLFYEVTLDKNYLLEGLKSLEKGQKLAPTDPKIPYSLSVYYSLLYDTEKDFKLKNEYKDKSLDEVDLALKLKSNFDDAVSLKSDLFKKYSIK